MRRRELGGGARAAIVAGEPQTDAELLHAVARGDRRAFGELYDRLAPSMLSLAYRLLRSRREAEDLVHDVFLECWQSTAQYDPARASVRTWFLVRARSRSLDRLRAARRAASVTLDEALAQPFAVRVIEQPALGEASMLQRLLLQLSAEQRAVVELGYFAGYTCAEIADTLAIPVGTVKSRMSRAVDRLRVLLQGP